MPRRPQQAKAEAPAPRVFVPAGGGKASLQGVCNPGRLSRYTSPAEAQQNKSLRLEVERLSTWVASLEQKLLASPQPAAQPAAAPGPAAYLANAGAPTYQKPAAYLANKAAPTTSVASSVDGSVAPAGVAAAAAAPKPVPPAGVAELISPEGDAPTPSAEPAAAINALLQRLSALDIAASGRPGSAPVRYNARPTAQAAADDAASVVSWSADAFGRSKTPGWYHTNRKQLYARRAKMEAEAPEGCFTSFSKYAAEASRIKSTERLAF